MTRPLSKARSRSIGWARPRRTPRLSRAGEGRNGKRPRSGAVRRETPFGQAVERAGSWLFELIERHDGNTYRAVYTVRFRQVVYVLHAFQKKSPRGIKTAKIDIDLIERRLKLAQHDL